MRGDESRRNSKENDEVSRKALPERFQALKNRNTVHQRLEKRLEDLGFETSELWDNPVEKFKGVIGPFVSPITGLFQETA